MLCKAKPPFLLSLILYLLSGNDNLGERRKTKIEKRREPKRNDNLLAKLSFLFGAGEVSAAKPSGGRFCKRESLPKSGSLRRAAICPL